MRSTRRPSPSRLVLAAFGLLAALPAIAPSPPAAAASPQPGPTVDPGGLVRWSAPGTERCAMDGSAWLPIGDTCWYPVDLLSSASRVTVVRTVGGERQERAVGLAPYPYPEQRLTITDQKYTDISKQDLARIERENRRIGAAFARRTERRFTLPLAPPLADLPRGGRFGSRRIINGVAKKPHTGADYAADAGRSVLAVGPGEVVIAEEHFFAGNSVFLDHGDGLVTMFFHLSDILVEEGQEVTAGEALGRVGSTGRSTGPHLHFGARWRGARVDPAALMGRERVSTLEP